VRKGGRVLEGLTQADFDVREDGVLQSLETFEFIRVEPSPPDSARVDPNTKEEGDRLAADPRNRVFVVYLDTFGTSPEGAKRVRDPLIGFLRRYMSPTDLFGVLTPLTLVRDLVFARRLDAAEAMIDQYWNWARADTPRLFPEERFLEQCFLPKVSDPSQVGPLIELWRRDKVLMGLAEAIGHLGALRDERKTLLLVSHGWIARPPAKNLQDLAWGKTPELGVHRGRLGTDPGQRPWQDYAKCDAELGRLTSIDFVERQRNLVESARRANVAFFPVITEISVWPMGVAAFDNSPMGTLRRMAEDTDGLTVVNELDAGLNRIGQDLSAYYLLGYYSTNTKNDLRFRKIDVKVKAVDATVSARRGYLPRKPFTPGSNPAVVTGAPAASATPAAVIDALKPLARLGGSQELFTHAAAVGSDVAIVSELSSSQAASSVWRQGADVRVSLTGANGEAVATTARVEPGTRSSLVHVAAGSVAGPWRAEVTLIASGGERVKDTATVDVPSASPLIGRPVVYRAAPSPRSPLQPVADFLFRRTERVHLEWLVGQPLDQREVRVLSKTGQPVATGATISEREANGQTSLIVDLSLAPLSAGDYVIEVSASRGGVTGKSMIGLRVGQ
jgi:VWFA-related protein